MPRRATTGVCQLVPWAILKIACRMGIHRDMQGITVLPIHTRRVAIDSLIGLFTTQDQPIWFLGC